MKNNSFSNVTWCVRIMLLDSLIFSLLLVGSSFAAPVESVVYDNEPWKKDFAVRQVELVPEEQHEIENKLIEIPGIDEDEVYSSLCEEYDTDDTTTTSAPTILTETTRPSYSTTTSEPTPPLDPITTSEPTPPSHSPTTSEPTPASDPTTTSEPTSLLDLTTTSDPDSPSDSTMSYMLPIISDSPATVGPIPSLPTIDQQKYKTAHYEPLLKPIVPVVPYPPIHYTSPIVQAAPYTNFGVMPRVVWQPVIQMQQVVPLPYTNYVPSLSLQSPYMQVPVVDYSPQMPQFHTSYQPSGYDLHQIHRPMNIYSQNDDSIHSKIAKNLLKNEKFAAIFVDVASKVKKEYHYDQRLHITAALLEAFEKNQNLKQILSKAYAEVIGLNNLGYDIDWGYESILRFVRILINNREYVTEMVDNNIKSIGQIKSQLYSADLNSI